MSDAGKSPWRTNMVPREKRTPKPEAAEADKAKPKDNRPKIATKPKALPARDGTDAYFAAMAYHPNPRPQPWMTDTSKLPKRPPGKQA